MKNWVVVANSARARVLEPADTPGRFVHRADLVHTRSRLKGVDLEDDRPGHMAATGHGYGTAEYLPRRSAHEREQSVFAREIATLLDSGVARGECAGLVLVASNPFLGRLHAELGDAAQKAVLRTVASDYTRLPDETLARRLGTVAGAAP